MKASTIKRWLTVHRWTSLVCMGFMLLLCLTGLPLIFAHEIDHALGNGAEPPDLVEPATHRSIDDLVSAAERFKDGQVVKFLVEDPDESDVWFVNMGPAVDDPDTTAFLGLDARTAEVLSEYPLDGGLVAILLRLHVDMFAGLPGMLFLGMMGVLLIASIASGVVLYAPFMRKLSFGTIRASRSRRTQWLDMHNLLGIVTIVWLTGVALTGVINTLSIPVFEAWKATQLAEMVEPYQGREPTSAYARSAQRALEGAQRAEPDLKLSFMAFPGNTFASPSHFVAFMRGKTAWTSKFLKPLLIDASSGEVIESRWLPWYATVLLLSQPLHFGDYGGMPLKVLWALLDVLAIAVLASGLYLWAVKAPSVSGWIERKQAADGIDDASKHSQRGAA
ncbi:MAG: PepSY-associated TM helix domain-containing protein [Myxococcota bacterium]